MSQCLAPLRAWQFGPGARLVFDVKKAMSYLSAGSVARDVRMVLVPCGKCAACRKNQRFEMGARAALEARESYYNSFLSLTYDDDHLPPDGKLDKKALQLFIKRLRKYLEPSGVKIRYLACGEYGSETFRPHYHICIFGWQPPVETLEPVGMSNEKILWRSSILDLLWSFGFATFEEFDDKAAFYTAGYVLKKLELSDEYKPFVLSSRRPGLGAKYFDMFRRDCVSDDASQVRFVFQGTVHKLPVYFKNRLAQMDEPLHDLLTRKRFEDSEPVSISDWLAACSEGKRRAVYHEEITKNRIKKGKL